MSFFQKQITVRTTSGKGMVEFTDLVQAGLVESGLKTGTVNVFCRHTSCSLVLMENADPSARYDLEVFMEKLVPERQAAFTHTLEGDDDMPSHIKMALTRTSETIPFASGRLCLGTWQGVFLWEHRRHAHTRSIVLTFQGE
jgi:secondary thiamine-phosphate synthase enzyme